MAEKNSDPAAAIVCARVFPQPREQVFLAFSDPVRLAQWWGPKGCTNKFHQFDFRPSGTWRFTMHGPDGAAFEMDHRFTEIMAPNRIVVRHLQPGHDFTLTISLEDASGGTRLIWRMIFDDPGEAERVRAFVLPANEQNFDRLAEHLSGSHPVVR
jgi:uncharacterized protein YndB with AHSA1/START domain